MSALGEFGLIARYFARPDRPLPHSVALGIGDDCALLRPSPGMELAISTDMLVSGRHFFPDTDPYGLGHKALAVNLSDLAACGAKPLAFSLALALPEVREDWLQAFSNGMFALADAHGCALIGGDTTRGPLNICITVMGEVPPGQALLRSGARPGDDIYVSGTLGDAALALQHLLGRCMLDDDALVAARLRLERPTPRVALGLALRGVASAMADVSDGLLGDLRHILESSGVGATLDLERAMLLIAARAALTRATGQFDNEVSEKILQQCVLAGGDDYELVFTAPRDRAAAVQAAALTSSTPVTRIGHIDTAPGLRILDERGTPQQSPWASFDHFATQPGA
jgi:thiamine-monophosphate kinase